MTNHSHECEHTNNICECVSEEQLHEFLTNDDIIYDATHSIQIPSGYGNHSGGNRDYAFPLMRAALTIGVAGIFAEVHPNPPKAISDQDSQLYLSKIRPILEVANDLFHQNLKMKAVYDHEGLL